MASVRTQERLRESIARQQLPNFFVDKLVMRECWPQIHEWLQLSSLIPYLKLDGLLTNNEVQRILSSHYESPGVISQLVYNKVLGLGDTACHLLYMCIAENHSSHLGHDIARVILETKGVCACACVCICSFT